MSYGVTIAALATLFDSTQIQATVIDSIGPLEYAWYRSTTDGFVPGPGNILSGDEEVLNDTGLIPNTIYYYVSKVTDTGNSNTVATSAQLTVTTASQSQSQNQFAQKSTRGNVDQQFNQNTISCIIDPAYAGTAYPGTPVKRIASSQGVAPVVTPCTAETDEVFGFINFDIKSVGFTSGMTANVSIKGNVLYLYATAAIVAGAQVQLDLANNGVKTAADSGDKIVGWAFDSAASPGQLFRVYVETPSYRVV